MPTFGLSRHLLRKTIVMPNPDFSEFDKQLGNKASPPKRKKGAAAASVNEKTAPWPGLPGKAGPNRSAGVKKLKVYASSTGL